MREKHNAHFYVQNFMPTMSPLPSLFFASSKSAQGKSKILYQQNTLSSEIKKAVKPWGEHPWETLFHCDLGKEYVHCLFSSLISSCGN